MFFPGQDQFASIGRANFEAGLFAFSLVTKSALACQGELANFAGKRFQKNAALAQQMLQSHGPTEALRNQAEFVRDAASDCVESTRHLMESGAQVLQQALVQARHQTDQMGEAVVSTAESTAQA